MSAKITSKGDQLDYENKRKFVYHNTAEKPFILNNVLNPSPLLYDKNEFPSLTESSQKCSAIQDSDGKVLKYSDKLKATCQNQNSLSKPFHLKNDNPKTAVCSQLQNKTSEKQSCGKLHQAIDKARFLKNSACENSLQTNISKSEYNESKIYNSSVKNYNQKQWNQSPKQSNFINQSSGQNMFKKNSSKQTGQMSPSSKSYTVQCASRRAPDSVYNQTESNKEIKCILTDKNLGKNGQEKEDGTKAKKKKKRKSKVKRQVALQTGKITVLTPEVHSKILNQSSALNSHNFKNTITDINNEEEYPELGKSFVPASQKENSVKKETVVFEKAVEVVEKICDTSVEKQHLITKEPTENNITDVKTTVEKKGKSENKTVVHPKDPITVSFFDMLLTKPIKTKVKDVKEEVNLSNSILLAKVKARKSVGHPHNLLDSSSPAVKRGKERENPKPKKPSHLKKIILLDRKIRREQLLHLSNQSEDETGDETLNGNEIQHIDSRVEAQNVEACDDVATSIISENVQDNVSSGVLYSPLTEELSKETDIFMYHNEEMNSLYSNKEFLSEITPEISDTDKNTFVHDYCEKNVCHIVKGESNSISKSPDFKASTKSSNLTENHMNAMESTDSLLKSLSGTLQTLEFSQKEKAAKILLHTRNFREYCNHLISADIDEAVFALLDDLSRFQDRMHQKDPVKARMKRRMIYGVKEVKKHIKLKKLKCIVIAVDIENVETEGGLNDILNDIKSLATDHHIPCVFALSRKDLGKVCHKPVPISCIGIFNYEGSEVNFKKMLELQIQSKKDYTDILKNLTLRITDEKAATLIKAKKEAPDTLHALRSNILRESCVSSKTEDDKHENLEETANE